MYSLQPISRNFKWDIYIFLILANCSCFTGEQVHGAPHSAIFLDMLLKAQLPPPMIDQCGGVKAPALSVTWDNSQGPSQVQSSAHGCWRHFLGLHLSSVSHSLLLFCFLMLSLNTLIHDLQSPSQVYFPGNPTADTWASLYYSLYFCTCSKFP